MKKKLAALEAVTKIYIYFPPACPLILSYVTGNKMPFQMNNLVLVQGSNNLVESNAPKPIKSFVSKLSQMRTTQ